METFRNLYSTLGKPLWKMCVGAFLSPGGNEAESETVKIIVDGVTYLLHYVMAFTL